MIVSSELHVPSLPIFVLVTSGRGSVLLLRRRDTLCTSGFMDDVIIVHTPEQLSPADGSTAYMQPWTWLCCKRRVGIPVAGHGLTLTGLLIGRRGLLGSSWRVEYSCHHVCT